MTLFEEVGGREAVELVVAGFYERVLADPQLQRFFRGVQMSRLQKNQVEFFCTALGGPPTYQGRDMVAAHAGMGITDDDFNRVAKHLVDTLEAAGVGAPLVGRVLALVGPLRAQIVRPG